MPKPLPLEPVPRPGDVIAVWFSCGAASAVAAKLTIQRYGEVCSIRVLNNPVAEEHSDNRRFLLDVQAWLGRPIEIVSSKAYPSQSARDVWEREGWMSGVLGARCTAELKRVPRQEWEKANPHHWIVMGFTSEEVNRFNRFRLTERSNLLPILQDAGMTKADCFRALLDARIRLPQSYLNGLPNANCLGCVKATSPTYWNLIRKLEPEIFADRSEQSRRIGARLVEYKGARVFLDELPPDAKGYRLKNLEYECGVFCSESPGPGD